MRHGELIDRLAVLLSALGPAPLSPGAAGPIAAACAAARAAFGAAAVSVAVVDGDVLRYIAADGEGAAAVVGTVLPVNRGLAGYAAVTGQSLTIDRPVDDPRFARDVADLTGFVPASLTVVPIMSGVDDAATVVGVLSLLDRATGDPPAWSEPFHDRRLGAVPVSELGSTITRDWAFGDRRGHGVRVAVIDSGIESGHPMVGAVDHAVVVERDDTTDGSIRFVEGPHDDLYGHGTACAAIIRALAPDVELISVRVLASNLKGSAFAFAHGLEWCLDHDVDVVNLSLSTSNESYAETFWDLLDRASFERVMVVSAMNNDRKRSIPSEFAGVFSVACAPGADRETFWWNPGGPAEWGAPGIDVDLAWSGGGTITATGNSFAAPVITGHLARIAAAHPGITPWQARTVLSALAANPG
jgi:subtilisin